MNTKRETYKKIKPMQIAQVSDTKKKTKQKNTQQ